MSMVLIHSDEQDNHKNRDVGMESQCTSRDGCENEKVFRCGDRAWESCGRFSVHSSNCECEWNSGKFFYVESG